MGNKCCNRFCNYFGRVGDEGERHAEAEPYDIWRDERGYVHLNPKFKERKPQYCLIFLHTLGDTAQNFIKTFNKLEYNYLAQQNVRICLPTAPKRPVEINDNENTTCWFNVKGQQMRTAKLANIEDVRKVYDLDDLE